MHIQSSRTDDASTPHVQVGEPYAAGDTVIGPQVQVWPFGAGDGMLWTLSVPEARAWIAALSDGVEQAEQLFGDQAT